MKEKTNKLVYKRPVKKKILFGSIFVLALISHMLFVPAGKQNVIKKKMMKIHQIYNILTLFANQYKY